MKEHVHINDIKKKLLYIHHINMFFPVALTPDKSQKITIKLHFSIKLKKKNDEYYLNSGTQEYIYIYLYIKYKT